MSKDGVGCSCGWPIDSCNSKFLKGASATCGRVEFERENQVPEFGKFELAVHDALDEVRKAARSEYLGFAAVSDEHLDVATVKLSKAIREHHKESLKEAARKLARA